MWKRGTGRHRREGLMKGKAYGKGGKDKESRKGEKRERKKDGLSESEGRKEGR